MSRRVVVVAPRSMAATALLESLGVETAELRVGDTVAEDVRTAGAQARAAAA